MARIKLEQAHVRIYQDLEAKEGPVEYEWMETDNRLHIQPETGLTINMHTEHRDEATDKGIYVMCIVDKREPDSVVTYYEPGQIEREWTQEELMTVAESMAMGWKRRGYLSWPLRGPAKVRGHGSFVSQAWAKSGAVTVSDGIVTYKMSLEKVSRYMEEYRLLFDPSNLDWREEA